MKDIWVLLLIKISFFRFTTILQTSLDSLAGNLEDSNLKHLMSEFWKDQLEILKRKDADPYEWVDSYKKFIYPRSPRKESFYSSIDDGKRGKGDGNISDEIYLHLKNVWNTFNFNVFRNFHIHYFEKRCIIISRCIWKICLYKCKTL